MLLSLLTADTICSNETSFCYVPQKLDGIAEGTGLSSGQEEPVETLEEPDRKSLGEH